MSTDHHTAIATGAAVNASTVNTPLGTIDQAVTDLQFDSDGIITLVGDLLTMPVGNGNRNVVVAAETGTADDLAQIKNMQVGEEILLRADTGDTITVKHNAGPTPNMFLIDGTDKILDEYSALRLAYVDTNLMVQVNNPSSGGTSSAILTDEKTTGTDGGSSSATTWNNRDLNTEQSDPDSIVSIASNQFTPISGTYHVRAYAPALSVLGNRLRLYNVTGTAVVQEGQTMYQIAGSVSQAILDCKLTANGTDAFRIDHYTQAAVASTGLGRQAGDGSPEVYLVIVLEKVS